jgi:hypothetical protein
VIPDEDTTQPPHVQAARYYKSVVAAKKGQFKVTMEHPSSNNPEPIVISIGSDGYKLVKAVAAPFVIASQQTAPRAG